MTEHSGQAEPRRRDEHGRAIFSQREAPDPFHSDSRFAQWLGNTCGPWVVLQGFSDAEHARICFRGWIRSGAWWFVCKRCHPDAIDKPGSAEHQHRPASCEPAEGGSPDGGHPQS